MRSFTSHCASSALSKVVLPTPVPPVISTVACLRTSPTNIGSQAAGNTPNWLRCRNDAMVLSGNRMEIAAPCGTNGAITACTRMPSGLAASAIGQASSSLRPSCAHSWTAYSRTTCGERNGTRNTVSRMPLPQSAQTRPSQVTARSVTCGSDATSFNRPKNTVLGTAPGSSARVITAAIPHHRSLQEAPETGRMACSTRSASKLTALRLPLVTDLMPRPSSTSPHRLTLGLTGPNTVAVK